MKRKRRKHDTAARNRPKIGAYASARRITFVTRTPLRFTTSAKESGNRRPPLDILPSSLRVQAPTVLFVPLTLSILDHPLRPFKQKTIAVLNFRMSL
ncbi:hypothetical protein AVEN_190623-1 [Araneus ventricosus]|uniref:Uncharacterized protein n=1 Tax=Araneus ventricosus TaxID=182803 RepID=A0A4Y2H4D8_ARAVE|nr:hypothetical protein AVEN_190623-1 [Araneus ventricosus]